MFFPFYVLIDPKFSCQYYTNTVKYAFVDKLAIHQEIIPVSKQSQKKRDAYYFCIQAPETTRLNKHIY